MWTTFPFIPANEGVIAALFWFSLLIVLLIVLVPVTRFYSFGWNVRKQDFTNRLTGKPIDTYLKRFWCLTIREKKLAQLTPDQQFSKVYDVINGRHLYLAPTILLALTLTISGGLAIMTGLRAGYEAYIGMYQAYAAHEGKTFPAAIAHLALLDIDRAFFPFPTIALTLPTLASVAGAFLSTAQVVIRGYKARTLLSSDLLWSTFRLVIAIPLGMAVGTVGADALAPLIGFGLGAFPISSINKLLRRLTARALNPAEATPDQDDLLKMAGINPDIAAQLNDDGIYSPQQLVDTDPVSLAVRAGLSFDFVVNLISQSQVWSWLGETTHVLATYGYGDARMIKRLVDGLAAGKTEAALALTALAAAVKIDENALKLVFQAIANDPYTTFLSGIS